MVGGAPGMAEIAELADVLHEEVSRLSQRGGSPLFHCDAGQPGQLQVCPFLINRTPTMSYLFFSCSLPTFLQTTYWWQTITSKSKKARERCADRTAWQPHHKPPKGSCFAENPLARLSPSQVRVLHSLVSPAEQQESLRRGPGPKVILATNIAESSITVPAPAWPLVEIAIASHTHHVSVALFTVLHA